MSYHVAMLSGGKDSTAMVIRAKESGEFIFDEYIFCDTGKEFPQMYEHLDKLESYLDIKITKLKHEKSFDYFFSEHVKTKGNNQGTKGYSWPDSMNRWCTTVLKQQESKRYLKKYDDVVCYEGIAIDEWSASKGSHRATNNHGANKRYPLCHWSMTESECLKYCYDRGFDWGGLYEDFSRVSCYCCPLSSLPELYTLWSKYPDLWAKTKAIESGGTYRTFRSDYSLDDLELKFKKMVIKEKKIASQLKLW